MKIDLSERVGLPVALIKTSKGWQLQFGKNVRHAKPQVRFIGEIRDVMKNPKANTPEVLYWIYRDVRLPEHEEFILANGLRYDLTVFNPGVLCVSGQPKDGDEWNKATGHYHPYTKAGKTFYELYEVVYGRGLFLLQEVEDIFAIPPKILRFVIIKVQAGDVIIFPPNTTHPTIALGNEPLVTANWIGRMFDSQYTPIKLMKGVAYYIVKSGDGWTWERNPAYPKAPKPKVVEASALGKELKRLGIPTGEPAYCAFFRKPEAYRFLVQ